MDLNFSTRTLRQRVYLTVVAMMIYANGALAECIVPPPPCQAMEKAAIVFVGDVTLAGPFEQQTGPNAFQFVPQPVRFRVVERFKGVPEGQTEVAGSVRFSAEAILFTSGLRYIVYASLASDGTWGTACSRTSTLKERPDEIRQLRKCKRQ
jgi:hypothetical protein